MKIVIPADEKKLESSVCISFGRAPYFIIYDTETKAGTHLENVAAAAAGGAGIKAAQAIADVGTNVLLTPRCGENAANVLKAAGVEIYKTAEGSVKQNIDMFLLNKLSRLDEIHAGFHGHGGE